VKIAAIIPTLDEAARIGATIEATRRGGIDEIIVADGGSADETAAIARAHDAVVLDAPRGRARQQNAGAAATSADALIFVHADCLLPRDAAPWIRATLARSPAGAFRTRTIFDGAGTPPPLARLLWLADLRGRLGRTPYGDQALFLRRDVFTSLGGFPDQPLMEDVVLSRRLGRIPIVPRAVTVSGRRFLAHPIEMTVYCHVFPLLHALGVSPARLARAWRAIR
jgi:glycosyltransferase involved in cell wall biosynthesis